MLRKIIKYLESFHIVKQKYLKYVEQKTFDNKILLSYKSEPVMKVQEERYRSMPDIFKTPYFFLQKGILQLKKIQ